VISPGLALPAWRTQQPGTRALAGPSPTAAHGHRRIRQSPFCELRLAAEAHNPPVPGFVPGPKGTHPERTLRRQPCRGRPSAAGGQGGPPPHAPPGRLSVTLRFPARPWPPGLDRARAAAPGGPRHWPGRSATRIRAAPALRWQRRGRRLRPGAEAVEIAQTPGASATRTRQAAQAAGRRAQSRRAVTGTRVPVARAESHTRVCESVPHALRSQPVGTARCRCAQRQDGIGGRGCSLGGRCGRIGHSARRRSPLWRTRAAAAHGGAHVGAGTSYSFCSPNAGRRQSAQCAWVPTGARVRGYSVSTVSTVAPLCACAAARRSARAASTASCAHVRRRARSRREGVRDRQYGRTLCVCMCARERQHCTAVRAL
jgi:hypothetical protein